MLAGMKLYEGRSATRNLIRAYDALAVTIGDQRLALPLLLTAERMEQGLESRSVAELTQRDLDLIVELAPNLVLAGTASGAPLVPAPIRGTLESRRIAIESMQLGAACRTFNVLVQEDREVLVLLYS
jgi:uncharacterized protein